MIKLNMIRPKWSGVPQTVYDRQDHIIEQLSKMFAEAMEEERLKAEIRWLEVAEEVSARATRPNY
jgi:hypothetical protein